MDRRTMLQGLTGLTAVTTAAAVLPRPAAADHRLQPLIHRLDQAADALLNALMGTAHHQDDRDSQAGGEMLAIMAAAALSGQAKVLHELTEGQDADANLRLAVQELDRQFTQAEPRIARAHATREVRRQLQAVRGTMDELVRGVGISRYRRATPAYERPYERDDRRYDRDDRRYDRDDRRYDR
jgi:hypothetical protein